MYQKTSLRSDITNRDWTFAVGGGKEPREQGQFVGGEKTTKRGQDVLTQPGLFSLCVPQGADSRRSGCRRGLRQGELGLRSRLPLFPIVLGGFLSTRLRKVDANAGHVLFMSFHIFVILSLDCLYKDEKK